MDCLSGLETRIYTVILETHKSQWLLYKVTTKFSIQKFYVLPT